jgi:predicted RNase H-like HicB family nuclease
MGLIVGRDLTEDLLRLVWLAVSTVDGYLGYMMKAEFTAIIESAPEGGFWAICPEIPGANGQGDTPHEAKVSLGQAIELIFEDRLADALRGLPPDVIRESLVVG